MSDLFTCQIFLYSDTIGCCLHTSRCFAIRYTCRICGFNTLTSRNLQNIFSQNSRDFDTDCGTMVTHPIIYICVRIHRCLHTHTYAHVTSYRHHSIRYNDKRVRCMLDDVINWKHFPRHWPLVRGIRRSPKASDAELWCFLWSGPESTVE